MTSATCAGDTVHASTLLLPAGLRQPPGISLILLNRPRDQLPWSKLASVPERDSVVKRPYGRPDTPRSQRHAIFTTTASFCIVPEVTDARNMGWFRSSHHTASDTAADQHVPADVSMLHDGRANRARSGCQ